MPCTGIPLGKQWWVGDGPIEPRVVAVKDKFFITFNAAMAFDINKHFDWTVRNVYLDCVERFLRNINVHDTTCTY